MPRQVDVELIRDRIPVRYRVHPLIRGFMIMISGAVCLYSVYFLIFHSRYDAPFIFKLLPFIIFFVGGDSLLKHLLSLNSITFWDEGLKFAYLAKKSLSVRYDQIVSMYLKRHVTYYLYLTYREADGSITTFRTKASFPRILEIMTNIYDLVPGLDIPDEITRKSCQFLAEQARLKQEQ